MFENPWNVKMEVVFDEKHKNRLVEFYEKMNSSYRNRIVDKSLTIEMPPIESISYLRDFYNSGYGLKLTARALGLTYTKVRTLFRYLGMEHRKGQDIVTERVKRFRSERVQGNKNPFYDWGETYPNMHKNGKSIKGYYKKKDGEYVYLRSSWEYIMAKWLDKHNIDWKYELKTYKLSNGQNYRPDFFIFKENKLKMIIEVKGSTTYFQNSNKATKLNEDLNDVKVIMITNINNYTTKSTETEVREWREKRLLEKG
jgi:hypothetical protein